MTIPVSTAGAVHLDHAGFIVRDLAATSAFMAQLGFTQTVRAEHTRTDAQGALVSAGSAQHSIMLQEGYLELMEIFDPAAGHQLAPAVRERFGLHIVAFGTDDADACHASCLARQVDAGPVLHWARAVQEPDLQGMARFAYFGSAWEPRDPGYLCWVQHQTPALLRSPRLLQHANGAAALRGLAYGGPRPLAEAWAAQLVAAGMARGPERADGIALALPNASIDIAFEAHATRVLPRAVLMAFDGLGAIRERARVLRLGCVEGGDGMLQIDCTQALGLHWRCVDANRGG